MTECARCKRVLTREPVIVNGKGYGSSCARKVQDPDLLTPVRKRVTTGAPRRRKASAKQPDLFQGAQ
jgi:hypothetical protein